MGLGNQLNRVVDSMGPTSSSANIDHEGAAGRPMSFPDKRRLSQRLSQVSQPELLNSIMAAVMQDPKAAAGASDREVEVDLDQLQPGTLWKLKGLLDSKEGPLAKSNMRGTHMNNLQQPYSELHPGPVSSAKVSLQSSREASPAVEVAGTKTCSEETQADADAQNHAHETEEKGDELWANFKSIDEQRQQDEETQKVGRAFPH